MKRRDFLKSLAAAAASSGAFGCASRERPAADSSGRPNIVFLFADQLRPDMLGPYGGRDVGTPHIDALAAEGMTFRHALSTSPLCTPYRGMLMTGRYPTHSGVLLNAVDVSPRQNPRPLARLFQEAGYDTGYLGKWHLSAGIKRVQELLDDDEAAVRRALERDPHVEFTPPGPDRLGFRHWQAYNYHTDFQDYWFYEDEPERVRTASYETDVLIDQSLAYIDRRRADGRPFLLVVAPHPPHPPFAPDYCPDGYLERMPHDLSWGANVPPAAARALEPQVRCYLAMIKHLDDCVGRLVRYLDESRLSPRTLLIVTSDHGEMHGSHGLTGKRYPYAESVNVPLIVRWPGRVPPGTQSAALYTPLDHLPTLCALARVDIPEAADGMNLGPVLLGEAEGGREAVPMMNYVGAYGNFKTGGRRPEWRGVHTGRHTYVRWLDGHEALFDNEEDPAQLRDLAATDPEQAELPRMRERLAALLTEAHDEFLPGTAYADWYAKGRTLVRTALGPVR